VGDGDGLGDGETDGSGDGAVGDELPVQPLSAVRMRAVVATRRRMARP
jgi:hypothetical protein